MGTEHLSAEDLELGLLSAGETLIKLASQEVKTCFYAMVSVKEDDGVWRLSVSNVVGIPKWMGQIDPRNREKLFRGSDKVMGLHGHFTVEVKEVSLLDGDIAGQIKARGLRNGDIIPRRGIIARYYGKGPQVNVFQELRDGALVGEFHTLVRKK